jgi:hypothetical protein
MKTQVKVFILEKRYFNELNEMILMSASQFSEDSLREYALGHLNIIEHGLTLVQYEEYRVDSQEIDLWCADKNGIDTFVELEYNPINLSSRRQVLDQKAALDRSYETKGKKFRHILFAPEIVYGDRDILERNGVEVLIFDKQVIDQKMVEFYESQELLKKVMSKLAEQVQVNVGGRPYTLDLIEAFFTPISLPDYVPKDKRFSGKGVHRFEIGTQLEMFKCLCKGRNFTLNPELLLNLLKDIFELPYAEEKRQRLDDGSVPRYGIQSTFADYVNGIPFKEGARKVGELHKMISDFVTTHQIQGDLLKKECTAICKAIIPRYGIIIPSDLLDTVVKQFELKSDYKDAYGRSYMYSMARRLVEIMVIKRYLDVYSGSEGTIPIVKPRGDQYEIVWAVSFKPRGSELI